MRYSKWLVFSLLLSCSSMAQAVVTVTGQVSPADPGTWTSSTTVFVGTTGTGGVEIDGTSLTLANIYTGYDYDGTLTLTNGSTLNTGTSASGLYYGTTGSILIEDGSSWDCNGYGYIGCYNGSEGTITVDGPGSTWSSGSIFIGYYGDGTLNITNGGSAGDQYGACYLGLESDSIGTLNVSGTNSTFSSYGDLYVGLSGTATMSITDGGLVTTGRDAFIGDNTSSPASAVTVSGTNSTWNISETLNVDNGAINIGPGGTVNCDDCVINNYMPVSTSAINVDGIGATFNNTGSLCMNDGSLSITNGGTANVGDAFSLIGMLSDTTAEIEVLSGSTLNTDGLILGYDSDATGIVNVDGVGSTWNNTGGTVHIGNSGTGTVNVTNGGLFKTNAFTLGASGTLNLNGGTLEMTDGISSATWNDITFTSGEFKLSGGTATIATTTTIGADRTLTVTGAGTTWDNGNRTDESSKVFLFGGDLNITDGATVSNYASVISYGDSVANVDGAGSNWTHSNQFFVGWSGAGTLNITNGGTVSNTTGWIGLNAGSDGEINVDGTGSSWNCTSGFYVGHTGTGELNITNGGVVNSSVGAGILAGYTATSSGTVNIDGAGSTWNNSSATLVGREGVGTLNITDGGTLDNVTCYIGAYAGAVGVVNVSGNDSTLANSTSLYVGQSGTGTLNIGTGGTVSTPYLSIGASGTLNLNGGTLEMTDGISSATWNDIAFTSGEFKLSGGTATIGTATWLSPGKTLTVTDTGIWDNGQRTGDDSSKIFLSGGDLNITDGGTITNYASVIATGGTSVANIDGAGSTWTNSDQFFVGWSGNATMNLTDGGAVSNTMGFIGLNTSSVGVANVDGAGSTWTNSSTLYVGHQGSGELNITDGGTVYSVSGVLAGYGSTPTGTVTIAGTGSAWINTGSVVVGQAGDGILNIFDDGLLAVGGTLYIDSDSDNDSFVYMADDGMLALYGDADDTINDFLGLITGTDAIMWYDDSIDDWDLITTAVRDTDYTLAYQDNALEDWYGYTILTVNAMRPLAGGMAYQEAVPEPGTIALLLSALLMLGAFVARKRTDK